MPGVVVRPVDVTISQWDCVLEESAKGTSDPRWDATYCVPLRAVRLGLSRIFGMREGACERILS
jgi:error-prone DNA polymerase